ncbi:unnamed protein product [Brassicogethes aeneus]|uniref:Transcription factor IIIC 90kDa subunit N-terminal domain-containing protein n=1 Tax=Brassicogethes aeneus TaxID=1431903 RepID=A0A9P0ASK6_BRAAE|nr:unnamed protein product [Brassicogethes aeneus]
MELKLVDHLKLSTKLTVNYACEYSDDTRFYVIGDTGIFIIEPKGQPFNSYPKLACRNDYIKPSNYMICDNVDADINKFYPDLDKFDLYESVCRIELSANLKNTSPLVFKVLRAHWSARDLVEGQQCALGVTTNVFGLEIYVKNINESEVVSYKSVLNVSEEIMAYLKPSWKRVDKLIADSRLKELKNRVENISTTAFYWGPVFSISGKKYSILFVGHINGHITVLRIGQIDPISLLKPDCKILGRYKTTLDRITALHWEQTTYTRGGLCLGDLKGCLNLLQISDLDEENVDFSDETQIWKEQDCIAVDKIILFDYELTTFLVIVKANFLIFNAINEEGQLFDRKALNAANFYVSGVEHIGENSLVVLTFTGELKKVTLTISYNKIHVEESPLNVPNIDFSRQRTHGFLMSKNQVLFKILTTPCRSRDASKGRQFINLYVFYDTKKDAFQKLWDNHTNSLRDYWDCFEALRLISFKEKRFPWVGIDPNLNYDKLSLTQLKTLRIISKISETLYTHVPKIESYDIKPYLILHYLVCIKNAVYRINKLMNMKNQGVELSKFQMRSIDLQNMFLKEMVVQDVLAKANVGETFIDEVYEVMQMANEMKFPDMQQCFWCGENILFLIPNKVNH